MKLTPLTVLLPTLAAAVAATLAGCATQALKPGDAVPYPEGYRRWFHVKSMVIEPGHPLYESFGGIHHVYANAAAERGLATGVYADGAVFAFDLLATDEGGNAIQEGKRKVLGVMHKSAAAFASTGGWGFAGFTDDGKDVVTDMRGQCFQCHEGQRQKDYVFSRLRP